MVGVLEEPELTFELFEKRLPIFFRGVGDIVQASASMKKVKIWLPIHLLDLSQNLKAVDSKSHSSQII